MTPALRCAVLCCAVLCFWPRATPFELWWATQLDLSLKRMATSVIADKMRSAPPPFPFPLRITIPFQSAPNYP